MTQIALDLLKTGKLVVYREKDRGTLIEIKTGRWTLDRVKQYADELMMEFERLAPISNLPSSVDRKIMGDVLLKVMKLAWKEA